MWMVRKLGSYILHGMKWGREEETDLDMPANALVFPGSPSPHWQNWLPVEVGPWSLQAPFLCLPHLTTSSPTPGNPVLYCNHNLSRERGASGTLWVWGPAWVSYRGGESPWRAEAERELCLTWWNTSGPGHQIPPAGSRGPEDSTAGNAT